LILGSFLDEEAEVRQNRHEQVVEIVGQAAGQLAQTFELLHLMDALHGRFALPRPGFDPLLQLRVGQGQFRRSLGHSPFKFRVQLLQLVGFSVQVQKHAHLGTENSWNNGNRDVFDGAVFITPQLIDIGQRHGRHEDDGNLLESRMVADHGGQLEPVQIGHDHIDQD